MKYISLDIETTGLNPVKNQVIEFAAVLEDTSKNTPLEELPKLELIVLNDSYTVDPYCLILHKDFWPLLHQAHQSNNNTPFSRAFPTKDLLLDGGVVKSVTSIAWLETAFTDWLSAQGYQGKPLLAGKNIASFDLPFLRAWGNWECKHRVLDPGSMYATKEMDVPPSLEDILKILNLKPTKQHRAYGDCLDVIAAIRGKMNGIMDQEPSPVPS